MSRSDLAPRPVRRSLIAPDRSTFGLAAVGAALIVFTGLAVRVAGTTTQTGLDASVDGWLFAHVGAWVGDVMLSVSEPLVTASVLVLIVVGAALARRWDLVGWAVVSPALAIVLAEVVFKPLVGRRLVVDAAHASPHDVMAAPGFAFPSGHETGVTAVTVELAVLVLLVPTTRRVRAVVLTVLALWTLIAAAGLVRNHYHFATDTIGAILLTGACVLGIALVADAVVRRSDRRRPQLT